MVRAGNFFVPGISPSSLIAAESAHIRQKRTRIPQHASGKLQDWCNFLTQPV
jgi:hypothetical protein